MKMIFKMATGHTSDNFVELCNNLSDDGFLICEIQPLTKESSNRYPYEMLFYKKIKDQK